MEQKDMDAILENARKEADAIRRMSQGSTSTILEYAIADGYMTNEPVRGTEHSAGLDVFVPKLNETFEEKYNALNKPLNGMPLKHPVMKDILSLLLGAGETEESIIVLPHSRVLIPTGLKFNIPEGTYLEVANRGGVASKQGLIFGAHIIDEDYQGVVFINLINTTDKIITVEPDTKLAQLIHKEYIKSTLKRVSEDQLYPAASQRGEGALGHTGK